MKSVSQSEFKSFSPPEDIISPIREMSSYEALWTEYNSVKKIADLFREYNHALPSEVARMLDISSETIDAIGRTICELLPFYEFTALFYRDFEYPRSLRDAKHPIEVLYYQGLLDLLSSRSVSVVGARKASEEGCRRARKLAKLLVENNFTVMSGLAEGIDTAAHTAAIEAGGNTIAVIGTALNAVYPKQNVELQANIAQKHLLVSQVPFYYYSLNSFRTNRFFFPERNKTMSALSEATVIVEASDTSGSLIQARAAIQQKRKLFILNSCFEQGLNWPETFLKKGAVRVVDGSEIIEHLNVSATK